MLLEWYLDCYWGQLDLETERAKASMVLGGQPRDMNHEF